MADEYIKRDTAYNYLTEYYNHRTDIQHQNLRKALNAIPSADVQPVVHGEWVKLYNTDDSQCACSICYRIQANPVGRFCKWCGADMRKEGE